MGAAVMLLQRILANVGLVLPKQMRCTVLANKYCNIYAYCVTQLLRFSMLRKLFIFTLCSSAFSLASNKTASAGRTTKGVVKPHPAQIALLCSLLSQSIRRRSNGTRACLVDRRIHQNLCSLDHTCSSSSEYSTGIIILFSFHYHTHTHI